MSDHARTFELALVMAGACSAGAYTAGVIDFLFEALTAWEEAKAGDDPTVPDHDVMIRAAAGTSAGGIVAALVGMLPFAGHQPIDDLATARTADEPANADRNLLYRSWVRDIDIRGLLAPSDINKETGHVPSLLNGEAIVAVADAAIATVRAALQRPLPSPPRFLANPLQLFLCFTNMQGVPYVIRMTSACGVRGHWVTSHAGCAHFAVYGRETGRRKTGRRARSSSTARIPWALPIWTAGAGCVMRRWRHRHFQAASPPGRSATSEPTARASTGSDRERCQFPSMRPISHRC